MLTIFVDSAFLEVLPSVSEHQDYCTNQTILGMYWYEFDEEEEDIAWNQAEAQAEEYGGDGAAKYIGNLGEIVIDEFFHDSVPDGAWEHLNANAIENANPEFNSCDFTLADLRIDVKTTVDIRKFSPMHSYDGTDDDFGLAESEKGFPRLDPSDDTDVFIFVLVTKPGKPSPIPSDPEEATGWAATEEYTGDWLALILGWMFADAIRGEAVGNLVQVSGRFTRLHLRDLYELFFRAGISPKS